jgi:hypothetical protein
MHEALGLKRYAENLTQITKIFRAMNGHLNVEERAIEETLEKALILSRDGMRKAVVVVSVIKEHCETLALILSDSIPGEEKEKLADALFYFSKFAKNTADNVKEATETLRKAADELQKTQGKLALMETAMERVHKELLEKQKAAQLQTKKRSAVYGGVAVRALLGMIVPHTVRARAAVIDDRELRSEFDDQREKVRKYMAEFTKMREDTMGTAMKIESKYTELNEINAKLTAYPEEGLPSAKSNPDMSIAVLCNRAKRLVEACSDFLENCK